MRKTLIYIAILAVLGTGVYFILPGKNDSMPFDPDEAGFTIKDTAFIGKIYLAYQDGESVTIKQTDSGWIVNNKYPVLKSTLSTLLYTFYTQAPLYPVTKAARENALLTMSTHGVKVELYNRKGKKMKVFYVGGSAVNNVGTNMLIEGAKDPYVVEAPGFVGYLTARYTPRLRDWRDRTVFNVPAEQIKSVSIKYADKPENSFTVTRTETDSPTVIPAKPQTANSPSGLNRRRANAYLGFFTNINCEGYLNGLEDNDTTFKTAPLHSQIDLTLKNGTTKHVDVYWMAVNKRSKNQKASDLESHSQDYDSDRLYAVTNNYQDTLMIQQIVFSNIYRKAHEFFMPDIQQSNPAAQK